MNSAYCNRISRLIRMLEKAEAASTVEKCANELDLLHSELLSKYNIFNDRECYLRKENLNKIVLNIRRAKDFLSIDDKYKGALYLLYKNNTDCNHPEVKKYISYAIESLKESMMVRYSPMDVILSTFRIICAMVVALLPIAISLVLPIITQSNYFDFGEFLNTTFDFQNNAVGAYTGTVICGIATTAALYWVFYMLFTVCSDFGYTRPYMYAYGAFKLVQLSICIYLVFVKYPNFSANTATLINLPLGLFAWMLVEIVLEIIPVFMSINIIYLDICVSKAGWILLLPVNLLLYPLNCIIDIIVLKLNSGIYSERFIYMHDEKRWESKGYRRSYDTETIERKELSYEKRTDEHRASIGVVNPEYLEYTTTSYVPVIKTKKEQIYHNYTQEGTYHSTHESCKSVLTRLRHEIDWSVFMNGGDKKYTS